MNIHLRLQIPAQEASAGGTLGPFIAQKGVKGAEFCTDFNTQTKIYPKGMLMNITLIITPKKTYTIDIRGFNISAMLKEKLNVEKFKSQTNISEAQIDEIVTLYQKYFIDKGIKQKIISSCKSRNIIVV